MTQPKKVVLVTGCTTGGIGYEVAKSFERNGCRVYAGARRVEAITNIEGLDIEKIYIDVVNEQSIKEAVEHIITKEGRIDILFNNAGIGLACPIIDMSVEQTRQLIDTNITSVILTSKAVAPHMIRQGSGLIANVGSATAYLSTPWGGLYSASKAAVHSLSDAMRLELAPFGVHVCTIVPGAIKSNIGDNNLKKFSLPAGSFYQSVFKYVMARANMSQAPNSTPTANFASYVVSKCLKSSPPRYIDYGSLSNLIRIIRYMPRSISEFIFAKEIWSAGSKAKRE
ncbi:oxidoreductase [Lobosporangium transversale]|uniref:Oxidoreductase n=1 Tax=Lobosporangium transversale TaxID=64571 RepID=A0A1Y2H230_9FUNG|nr:oxidoreductase [Lobosporangium transversale]ORZ28617.1 oxidoreductase [Lobosporangium transversale]|eukprot:XP_021886290.1 oxidoreductase [Lobosporangium transversale]